MLTKETARKEWRARFSDNTRAPSATGLVVKAAVGDTTELMLYDEIGFWGVTAKQFNEALAGVTSSKILLRINSPGGDVFDGYAMYNALKAHKATVAVVVEGLAASAASYVALAGDTVSMGDPAMMMIHRAWTVAFGNCQDMTATAGVLGKVDGQIADIYAGKTGKSAADMLALMDAETWLTAAEAGELGLVDEVLGAEDDEAKAKAAADILAHNARSRAAAAISRRAA